MLPRNKDAFQAFLIRGQQLASNVGGVMVSVGLLKNAEDIASVLSILGNGKRLAILYYLLQGELPVNVLAQKVGLSQSALSQHLAKLREREMVETRRDRQMIYYSCGSETMLQLLRGIDGVFAGRYAQ